MPLSYTFKRLIRSWQLYIALLLGIILASTFFAGINVGADTAAKQALDQALNSVPVDFYASSYDALSSKNITSIVNAISTVPDVVGVEAIPRVYADVPLPERNTIYSLSLIGLSEGSSVYEGWADRPSSLEVNQTYVLAGSPFAGLVKKGDVIQVNMSLGFRYWIEPQDTGVIFQNDTVVFPDKSITSFVLNLTVAGFAQFNDEASAIVQGQYYAYQVGPGIYPTSTYAKDLLIVDLEKTLAKFIDVFHEMHEPYFQTDIIMYINRNSLISVWDIQGSLQRLDALKGKIENQAALIGFRLYVSSALDYVLSYSQMQLSMMRLSFLWVSLPVFFVAWYMGTTVSDVSFNLRRREIGLLLTKGFSRRQVFRMFLTEALLIGLAGGIIGIALSVALNPLFVRVIGGEFSGVPFVGTDTAILTIIFSVIITVLAVFRPARRASNLSTVDALREYMYVEEVKPYKKLWPWVAFALGTYKMIMLLLGVNLIVEVTRLGIGGWNVLLVILIGIWAIFDFFVLTLAQLGPLLFFWGFTKIFIRGSLKFQEITARAAKFLGDLGTLATRNVQRNPARAASVAFLVALIIGYGIQITGILASSQDYNIRVVYATVGADVKVALSSPVNVSATSDLMNNIRSNVSDVASTTPEYYFSGTSTFEGLQLRAVLPSDWLNTAYYEDGWFSGCDVKTAFQQMLSNNHTILLYRDIASRYYLDVGDRIRVSFGSERLGGGQLEKDLTIVGFFGAERPSTYVFFGSPSPSLYWSWSYVPEGLFHELGQTVMSSSSATILVKLNSGTDSATAANQIRTLAPKAGVQCVSEELQRQQSELMYTGMPNVDVGTLNIQRLGVAFAILATSVGTALVTFVSLKERQREASMMSVRGLSFKQLTIMLLTENLAVVTFAVLLGAVAGLIIVHGTVVSPYSSVPSLIERRVIFPPDALLTILVLFALVFASTIVPVILMTRRYISRLERVVRQG